MTKNEAIQAAHHWQQRAEAAEKFAAGLELNLVAVIQRAEAAEKCRDKAILHEREGCESKYGLCE